MMQGPPSNAHPASQKMGHEDNVHGRAGNDYYHNFNQEMLLYKSLHRAQQVMKKCVDAKRSLADFRVGDTVFAKLQPYQQHSVPLHQNQMLEFREIANGADSVMQRLTKEETSNLVAAILRRSCL
ncbi:hypothetical protein KIW84_054719 [Lathyrus oleraceus]|uniref:Uncharacterized protein n=1 Tax=Pisum sativum TaxID=3888 RepID=A0A9D4WYN3_PEA|nr:hypothetical protein KIW84_054719 [Pisum sativum]